MFPEPVAYVDFAGVIGDAPRVLPFLTSGWGLDGYRRAGRDLVVERMAHEPVPLVIANHAVIESAVTGERGPEALRVRDRAILHDNFIQHWGPVWVAGKRIEPSRTTGMMEIAVPGTYTLEGAAITIDGRSIQPGEFVTLGRGPHPLRSDPRAASTLRWGQNLPRPSFASPGTLFTEY